MKNYRITKYNPYKRNEEGHYTDPAEWTSIDDIGKIEYNSPLYSDYEKTESAYVQSIILISKLNKVDEFEVNSLESINSEKDFKEFEDNGRLKNIKIDYNNDIESLVNGHNVNLKQSQKLIRLILRETVWLKLLNPRLNIEFGYDYYMYIQCEKLSDQTKISIEELGLYVESYNKSNRMSNCGYHNSVSKRLK